MTHGLLWLPLLLVFVLLPALGWLERRRQHLFRQWAGGSETGQARWLRRRPAAGRGAVLEPLRSRHPAGGGTFPIKSLELVELLSLGSGEAPLTDESQGRCRLRLVARAGRWMCPSPMPSGPAPGWRS